MVRAIGPDEADRLVYTAAGVALADGFTGRLYADSAATTAADLLELGGAPIAVVSGAAVVPIDGNSKWPRVQYPDGVKKIYGSVNGGPIVELRADLDDQIDTINSSASVHVAAPTGVAATDTGVVQTALTAAAVAGGGRVVLSPGGSYVVTGLTIDTGVVLDLNSGGLTLAPSANTYLVSTVGYAGLIGGDTTGGPRDFGIVNGYLDGGKAGQSDITKPVLAIYGRRYVLDNLMVRNGKGAGIDSEWSTTSPFQAPNGFESFVTRLYVHSCDGDGINFRGPHDAYFSTFFIVKCATLANAAPLRLPDASGRANGSNFQQFHIYGGFYDYGFIYNSAGTKVSNFVVEGATIGQVLLQASQAQITDFHLYTGGVATATAKGIVVGDASHTNVGGVTAKGRIENCGGGAIDFAFAGNWNDIDIHEYYYTATAPTQLGIIGTVPANTRLAFLSSDNTFTATTSNQQRLYGRMIAFGVDPAQVPFVWTAPASLTQPLVEWRNSAGTATWRINKEGRAAAAGNAPTVAALAANGTTPATPAVSNATDTSGAITFGSGSGPTAGSQVTVTFAVSFATRAPRLTAVAGNAATAALGMYITNITTTSFDIGLATAPAASQSAGTYIVRFHADA